MRRALLRAALQSHCVTSLLLLLPRDIEELKSKSSHSVTDQTTVSDSVTQSELVVLSLPRASSSMHSLV